MEHEISVWNIPSGQDFLLVRKNRTTISDVLLLPETFHWNVMKSRIPFLPYQPDFSQTFSKWYTTAISIALVRY